MVGFSGNEVKKIANQHLYSISNQPLLQKTDGKRGRETGILPAQPFASFNRLKSISF